MKNMIQLMVVIVGLILLSHFDGALAQSSWPMFGQNTANTASNPSETSVSAKNAKLLGPSWTFTTGGDVTARAAVVNGVAYFQTGPEISTRLMLTMARKSGRTSFPTTA